MEMHNVIQKK